METEQTLNTIEIETLRDKIKGIRVAMMTTLSEDGNFHTRPMATQEMEDDGTMWFFAYDNAPKINEVDKNSQVTLSFSDSGSETYVVTYGYSEVVKDKAKMDELWSDALNTWFPKGKDDPSIVLLKVTTQAGEYWDHPGGKVMSLLAMARGAITGQPDLSSRNEKLGGQP
ncbi:pyridoxamine 5'-phosphate oxidase family protein [Spirosoma harenae]